MKSKKRMMMFFIAAYQKGFLMSYAKKVLVLGPLLACACCIAMQQEDARIEGVQNEAMSASTSRIEDITGGGEDAVARRRDVYFKTVALIKIGQQSKHVQNLIDCLKSTTPRCDGIWWLHPLCQHSGYTPYKDGNGGLLNPALKNYEMNREQIEGPGYTGVCITLSGCVSADGIAPYKFDDTHIGSHYEKYVPYQGHRAKKDHYRMSMLEEAILGFLHERIIDRQKSDLCKGPFLTLSKLFYAKRFAQCVKHEFTSAQNEQDSGIRTEMESELIQRYMARSAYWPSQWRSPKDMRAGERMRREWLDGANDPHASVELNEFEVNVKMPGTSENNECSIM